MTAFLFKVTLVFQPCREKLTLFVTFISTLLLLYHSHVALKRINLYEQSSHTCHFLPVTYSTVDASSQTRQHQSFNSLLLYSSLFSLNWNHFPFTMEQTYFLLEVIEVGRALVLHHLNLTNKQFQSSTENSWWSYFSRKYFSLSGTCSQRGMWIMSG